MKRVPSIIAALFGVLSLSIGLLNGFGSSEMIKHTIENSRKIEASFHEAISFVEQFQKNNSRFPTEAEFTLWASSHPERPYTPYGMQIQFANFPEEVLDQSGPPSIGSYLLSYWRGKWMEYYPSWAGRTSLKFEKKDYYILGSPMADGITFLLLSAMLFYGAFKLWNRPNNALKTDAQKARAV